MIFLNVSRALFLTALALAASALWTFSPGPTELSEPDWVVHSAEDDLGPLAIGRQTARIAISNLSARSRRVLGMRSGCRPNVCFEPVVGEPITIGPGETSIFSIAMTINGLGSFEVPVLLFLEKNGITQVELVLRGVGVASEDSQNDGNRKTD